MKDTVTNFYDDLAEDYHLIYADWDSAIERQSLVLNKLIQQNLSGSKSGQLSLLDCSCGIGTQSIGMAKNGYAVTATDISSVSIQRAKREAELRGININFSIADFRLLTIDVPGEFDIVLSADNAISHLQSDDDLYLAAQNMFAKVGEDGLLVITIRDYDRHLLEKANVTQPMIYDNGKRIVFQAWEWANDYKTYVVNQFVIQEINKKWMTKHFSTIYRALKRDEISRILKSCGFTDVRWHMPEETDFYQPIVTARKLTSSKGT